MDQIGRALAGRAKPASAPAYPVPARPAPPIDESASLPPARSAPRSSRTGALPIGQAPAGHTGAVVSVAFAADGRILATGSYDRTARLWDVADPSRPARSANP
ncbi:WD40 repeat domain-containing protein [Frankia sp. AgB1.9]|uniref:WD40 repeat domain-containing protein n=1 Tax=Frankia sp. AgB1.9 TaxID=1836968 RepID=UPI0035ADB737